MSDEQHKKGEEAEVEGHRMKHPHANDEPDVELHRMKHPHANDEPDVELHRMKHPHASDEPRDEMESDDEVEAHRLRASRYTKN